MENKYKYRIDVHEDDVGIAKKEIQAAIGIDLICFNHKKDNNRRSYYVPLADSIAIILCLKVGRIQVKKINKKKLPLD